MPAQVMDTEPARLRRLTVRRRFSRRGIVGLGMVGLVVLVAVIGPLLAPDDAYKIYCAPYTPPSGSHLLGLDYLGRDALSRFLDGGRSTSCWRSPRPRLATPSG
jgi:peptide/nickel transport system permease protein